MLSVPDAQGVSYLWPDGSTAPQLQVQQPGKYSLVLTHNTNGCSDTLSVEVYAAPAWSQSIEASSDFLCDEVPGIKLGVVGTSGGSYSYAWSSGSEDPSEWVTTSGVYQLTLTDNATGCSTVLSRVVQNSDTDIALRIEAPGTHLCRDSEMTLRAVLDGLHESLRERVRLQWWHDGSEHAETNIRKPERYGVTADFGGGCVQEVIIEITQAPDLTVRIQSQEDTRYACPESPLLLRAEVSDSTAVAAYHWTGGADTPEAVFTESGPYTLLVTDVNGCVWEDRFEVQPCPTIVFFDTLRVQVKAEETAELCLRLVNPSQETATTVEVAIEGSPAPYFGEAEALRSVSFAPGETRQCLSYLPPRVEEADSITVYTLRLQNADGGNQAAIGEVRQAELLIEAGIRCRVQQDSAAVNCAVTDTTSIQNGVPLISTLKKDDSFWAGDFEVKVTQANGNGTFNGKGIITVPYLKQAQINVILKDVRVNEACQMVAGEVKVEGVGAAILSEELANALNDLLGTLDDIDGILGRVEDVFNTISTVINASSEVNSVLSTNWNVLHGADPIYNEYPDLPDSLRQQINEALLCYLSQPPSVCNAQLSQTIAAVIAAINALFEADYAIQFRRFPQQHYGFDSLMYQPAMVDDYNFLTVANQPYRVAWKSVEAGRTDSVLLVTPYAQLPDSLHFETNSRTPVPHHEHACGAGCADNGAAILPVTGGEHNKTYQIYPVQTRRDSLGNPERKYAGKLNVVSYNNKVTQVVIVPINGAGNLTDSDRAAIESQLNEIYRPAVAAFIVELLLPTLQLGWFESEAQNTLDSTNSAFYADYNAQMQRINQEINRLPGYDPEKYYLIVVQNAQGGIKGFMPRARNKGFIVAAGHGSLSDLGRTMAHELGHGAFRLRHPWEQFSGLAPGDTDNLMDYASGTRLHHYQWHIVHNPPPLAGLLDGDEEGELAEIRDYTCKIYPRVAALAADSTIVRENKAEYLVTQMAYPIMVKAFPNPGVNESFAGFSWVLNTKILSNDSDTCSFTTDSLPTNKVNILKLLNQSGQVVFNIKISVYKAPPFDIQTLSAFDGEFGFDDGCEAKDSAGIAVLQAGYVSIPSSRHNFANSQCVKLVTLLENQEIDLELKTTEKLEKAKNDPNFQLRLVSNDSTRYQVSIGVLSSFGRQAVASYSYLSNKKLRIKVKCVSADPMPPFAKSSFGHIFLLNQVGDTLGVFSIYSRRTIQYKDLTIVKVRSRPNAAFPGDSAAIVNHLNTRAYNQAFIQFENVIIDTFDVSSVMTANFTSIDSCLRELTSAYKYRRQLPNSFDLPWPQNTRYYLFITDYEVRRITTNSSGVQVIEKIPGMAFMVRNQLALFKGFSNDTAAHEVGHTHKLDHTFRPPYKITRYSTNNYMDYVETDIGSDLTRRRSFFLYQFVTLIQN